MRPIRTYKTKNCTIYSVPPITRSSIAASSERSSISNLRHPSGLVTGLSAVCLSTLVDAGVADYDCHMCSSLVCNYGFSSLSAQNVNCYTVSTYSPTSSASGL